MASMASDLFPPIESRPAFTRSTARDGDSVVWGPFPLLRVRLFVGLAVVAFGLGVGFLGALSDTLTCTRSAAIGGAGECVYQSGKPRSSERRFALADLSEVSVRHTETRNKGSVTRWGQLVLHFRDRERNRDLMMTRELAEHADPHERELTTFLRTPTARQLRIDTHRYLPMAIFALLMLLAGLCTLYSVLSGRRRFRCTWDPLAQVLSVQQEWPLGVRTGAPTTLALRSPAEVEIQWGHFSDFWTSSRMPGPRAGLLQVRLADGTRVPLGHKLMLGYQVHLVAAEALRELLGCPRRSLAEADQLASAAEAARPPPPPGMQGPGGKVAAVWIGTCCGSLAGVFVGMLLALSVGHQKLSDPAGGAFFIGGMLAGMVGGVWFAWHFSQNADLR